MLKKLETIKTMTGACRDYTHRHNQVANIFHQELAIKCGLSNGPSISYCKYAPQSVLQKLYYDRSIRTDRTVRKDRPDILILDKAIKEAYVCNRFRNS